MATTSRIEVRQNGPLAAIREFLAKVLADEEIASVMAVSNVRGAMMPTVVTDPEKLSAVDPFAPAFHLNAARQVARLTRGEMEGHMAAVLRPCEIRAFTELVKLNQGSPHNIVLIGVDCYGAYASRDYHAMTRANGSKSPDERTLEFMGKAPSGGLEDPAATPSVAQACRVCEHPSPEGADIILGLFGADASKEMWAIAKTPTGEGLLNRLGLPDADSLEARDRAVEEMAARRLAALEIMNAQTAEKISTPEKMADYLADCVNCYNCRVACPVCYCKECVFVTDVFEHEPWQYQGWARKKGALRVPVDTMFYHLTRLAHSSTACVGCGQCSNACPNDIPVMEMFRLVGGRTQAAFGYEAGRDPDEPQPLSVFLEKELAEVTGGVD